MDRHLTLGLAAALMAAPIPALAQTWPAGAVATTGYRNLAPETRMLTAVIDAPAWRAPPPDVATWIAPPAPKLAAIAPRAAAGSPSIELTAPEVKVPAKAEWTDDQGFRLHYAEIIYKQRF